MSNQDGQNAVNFQSESGNVEFQAEAGQQQSAETSQAGVGERLSEAAQNVNWNKVGVGVGAAAAVAGAAYAASKLVGRGEKSGERSESSQREPGDN